MRLVGDSKTKTGLFEAPSLLIVQFEVYVVSFSKNFYPPWIYKIILVIRTRPRSCRAIIVIIKYRSQFYNFLTD
jgi:hypothetical protein